MGGCLGTHDPMGLRKIHVTELVTGHFAVGQRNGMIARPSARVLNYVL